MIKTRLNVFETNSSSTHSLIMCGDSEYTAWAKGDMYYCSWFPYDADESLKKKTKFYTLDEAKAICESADLDWEDPERKEFFLTLDEFCEDEYLESGQDTYTTPGGETIHAVFKYGYNG